MYKIGVLILVPDHEQPSLKTKDINLVRSRGFDLPGEELGLDGVAWSLEVIERGPESRDVDIISIAE